MHYHAFPKSKSDDLSILNKTFFSHYKPLYIIGSGSFGKVYCCLNTSTNEEFAMKLESKSSLPHSFLEHESQILLYLNGSEGIPYFQSYGYSDNYRILIYELLGKSLDSIIDLQPGHKFSIKTVCLLMYQMICNIIHNDIIL